LPGRLTKDAAPRRQKGRCRRSLCWRSIPSVSLPRV
jgi:hypothetical protein